MKTPSDPMNLSDKIRKQFSAGIGMLSQSLKKAGDVVHVIAGAQSERDQDCAARMMLSMMHQLIWADGECPAETVDILKDILITYYSGSQTAAIMQQLSNPETPAFPADFDQLLPTLSLSERSEVMDVLMGIAMADGMLSDKKYALLTRFALVLELPDDTVARCLEKLHKQREKNKNFAVSISGMVTAVVIIVLFVLTATYLRSVFFGLILAFFLLPVQQLFYRYIFNTVPYRGMLSAKCCLAERLGRFFGRKRHEPRENPELTLLRKAASHSAMASFLLVLFAGCVIVTGLTLYSLSYVNRTGRDIRLWADELVNQEHARTAANAIPFSQSETDSIVQAFQAEQRLLQQAEPDSNILHSSQYLADLMTAMVRKSQDFAESFRGQPNIYNTLKKGADFVGNPENRRQITAFFAQKLNDAVPTLMNFLGSSVRIGTDIGLTIFFCALFMQIFAAAVVNAQYRHLNKSPGYYMTSLLFSTVWFPNLPEEARTEAAEILDNVIQKITVWIRGYFTIILVEAPLYILIFSLIDIPYPVILGLLSSCALLIPIIAPTLIVTLTLLMTLTMPGVRLIDLLMVAGTYGAIMGIFEAFVLYPRLVGLALGLNLLETVAVVLLGGYLFGLPGLLLAVPTASVIKYLVPRIWQCWNRAEDHHSVEFPK